MMTQYLSQINSIALNLVFLISVSCSSILYAQEDLPVFSPEELEADFQILKKAYKSLHPGLYRYESESIIGNHFDDLECQIQTNRNLAETFLLFSKFLAKIKCGHTYTNYWNQSSLVKKLLFNQENKVPFTFKLVDNRMVITKNASGNDALNPGVEVISINGYSVSNIIDSLKLVIKKDGTNEGQQLYDMQLTGIGKYESFDIYFPLFFPPSDGQFEITLQDFEIKTPKTIIVNGISRARRFERLEKRYGKQIESYDDLWNFKILNSKTAYLHLGTFVTWKMELDWKQFLKEAFETIEKASIPNLILDIRGNGGGMNEVNDELMKYLVKEPIQLSGTKSLIAYEKIPHELDAYLSTWDNSFKDISGKVKAYGDGFFIRKNTSFEGKKLSSTKKRYLGKTWLLVDAANSSATFFLAKICKEHRLATLVGETTGGNLKGTTGGQLFFLNLPNSKIEMDIPLIADYPLTEQPDKGLEPDIMVKTSIEHIANGVDTQLEEVLKMILNEGDAN